MAIELNELLFDTIRNDVFYKSLTGATTADPRIYKSKTPVKITISSDKPAYSVYRRMGTIKLSGGMKINIGQLNDSSYSLEIFSQKDTLAEEIAERVETIFYEANFFTSNLRVGYTWATSGSLDFDDGRQLWLITMSIYFTKILKLIS